VKVYSNMTFADMVGQMYQDFLGAARPVDVGQWQGLDIKGDASKVTWEIREAVLQLGHSMEARLAKIEDSIGMMDQRLTEVEEAKETQDIEYVDTTLLGCKLSLTTRKNSTTEGANSGRIEEITR